MIKPVANGDCDVTVGSRFLSKESIAMIPFRKRILLRCAIIFEWIRTGIKLTDAHCGFRCLNQKAYTLINIKYDGYAHASEILSEIRRHRLSFSEVPVSVLYERRPGEISDLKRIFDVVGTLLMGSKT